MRLKTNSRRQPWEKSHKFIPVLLNLQKLYQILRQIEQQSKKISWIGPQVLETEYIPPFSKCISTLL